MKFLKINRNLKFIPKKEIPHKLRNYIIYQFIGVRKNYYILNSNYRKRNFIENLKLIKLISYKNPNIIMITEFKKLKFTSRRTLIYKNEWVPGFLLRFYCVKKKGQLRKLPLLMINISNEERTIPILEALKINITTFSFTTFKRKSFILSDFSYPINFNPKKFSRLVSEVIITNIINSKYYKNLYFKDTLQDIYKKIKAIKIIKKKYRKIYKKKIKKAIKIKIRRKIKNRLKRKLYLIHKKNIKKLLKLKKEFRTKMKNRYGVKTYSREKKRFMNRRWGGVLSKPRYNIIKRIFRPKYNVKPYKSNYNMNKKINRFFKLNYDI